MGVEARKSGESRHLRLNPKGHDTVVFSLVLPLRTLAILLVGPNIG